MEINLRALGVLSSCLDLRNREAQQTNSMVGSSAMIYHKRLFAGRSSI